MSAVGPQRIALVTTFYPPFHFGGDAIAVRSLARALARRGHEVTVVHDTDGYRAMTGRTFSDAELAPRTEDGVRVVPLRTRLPRLSSLVTHQLGVPGLKAAPLREALRGPFDVVHYHNVSLVGGPGMLGQGGGVQLYTAHEHWLVCPTHVLWRDGREPCTERRCLTCALKQDRPPQLWRYTPMLHQRLGRMDAIIAQSEFSRAQHEAYGLRHTMRVLPPIVEDLPRDAAPAARDAAVPAGAYVLYAGRLEVPKGVDSLLSVFAREGSAAGAHLVIAGDGSAREAFAARAAGNPRITFLGAVDAARLASLYAHASALVVPSRGAETFGLVVVEGMRAGVPVIARRSGPLPELLAQAQSDALFDTDAELDALLTRAVTDEAWRTQAIAAGRAAFARHWSESVVMPRYLGLLQQLAEARTQPSVARVRTAPTHMAVS